MHAITDMEALPNWEEVQEFIEFQARLGLHAQFEGATKVWLAALEKLTEDDYSILTYTNCLTEATETVMIHDSWIPHILNRYGPDAPFWVVKLRLYVLKEHHYIFVQSLLDHTDALEETFQRKKQALATEPEPTG